MLFLNTPNDISLKMLFYATASEIEYKEKNYMPMA